MLGALVLGVAGCGGEQPEQMAPSGAGPSVIDLSGWKLSIPVKNNKGHPTLLQPAYTVAPWMVSDPSGALVFWAPSKGVTTDNSDHPRTELDSLATFNAGQSTRTLRASVTLQQVPTDGQGIILGQIHGAEDISSVPYVMLRYQQGKVRVVVKQVQDGDDLINYPLLVEVPLNSRFDFTISDLGNGNMTFSATRDGNTQQVTAPVPAAFSGATVRFQAGDYQQSDDPAGAQDGGRVVFHQLVESPSLL
ncbi:MAG: polysaccharide lyase family 7 protein [Actinomycetota bacterium]|nr:polysaccharide lyase family 7 protein [Actinomycetota bacterium]